MHTYRHGSKNDIFRLGKVQNDKINKNIEVEFLDDFNTFSILRIRESKVSYLVIAKQCKKK